MKSKFILWLVVMTLSFSVVALAQKKNDDKSRETRKPPVAQQIPNINPKPKTMLSCSPGGGKDVSTPLYVKNTTAQDLPAGTIIFWSAVKNGTATGKQTTTEVLKKNSGNQVSLLGPPDNIASCQAWILK